MKIFADKLIVAFEEGEQVVDKILIAKYLSVEYGNGLLGALVSFDHDGVRMHVRHDSLVVFLVKTFEYSRDSDTPFDVGPYPDEHTPPFLRDLDPFHKFTFC